MKRTDVMCWGGFILSNCGAYFCRRICTLFFIQLVCRVMYEYYAGNHKLYINQIDEWWWVNQRFKPNLPKIMNSMRQQALKQTHQWFAVIYLNVKISKWSLFQIVTDTTTDVIVPHLNDWTSWYGISFS